MNHSNNDVKGEMKTVLRNVNDLKKEGINFFLILKYISYFYINIMKGRIKRDSPITQIHYARDWEYPWVFIKSEIQPNYKILDCGSGYSPLPFIWSMYGAEVYAIDKDIMICSKFMFALQYVLSKFRKKDNVQKDILSIGRIWKSDLWGPISPKMIRTYGVNYEKHDITELPYSNDYFDVVSCVSVLEHLGYENQMKAIKEMSRVLRKNGKLIITYDNLKEGMIDRDEFNKAFGMIPIEITHYSRSDLYNKNLPDIIGICLVKKKS